MNEKKFHSKIGNAVDVGFEQTNKKPKQNLGET